MCLKTIQDLIIFLHRDTPDYLNSINQPIQAFVILTTHFATVVVVPIVVVVLVDVGVVVVEVAQGSIDDIPMNVSQYSADCTNSLKHGNQRILLIALIEDTVTRYRQLNIIVEVLADLLVVSMLVFYRTTMN